MPKPIDQAERIGPARTPTLPGLYLAQSDASRADYDLVIEVGGEMPFLRIARCLRRRLHGAGQSRLCDNPSVAFWGERIAESLLPRFPR